jgi:hypothetical protein
LHWYYSKISRDQINEQRRRVALDEKLRAEIQAREQALAELARQAQLQEPDFAWLHNLTSLPVEEVQACLAADETLIEYYFDADELKVFLIDRESVTVTRGAGTRDELKELLSELALSKSRSSATGRLFRGASGTFAREHQSLFARIVSGALCADCRAGSGTEVDHHSFRPVA